jgi:hypothetical protein
MRRRHCGVEEVYGRATWDAQHLPDVSQVRACMRRAAGPAGLATGVRVARLPRPSTAGRVPTGRRLRAVFNAFFQRRCELHPPGVPRSAPSPRSGRHRTAPARRLPRPLWAQTTVTCTSSLHPTATKDAGWWVHPQHHHQHQHHQQLARTLAIRSEAAVPPSAHPAMVILARGVHTATPAHPFIVIRTNDNMNSNLGTSQSLLRSLSR